MTTPQALALASAAMLAAAPLRAPAADLPPPEPQPEPVPKRPGDADLAAARKAIEAKDWAGAIQCLGQARMLQPRNADVYNLLGYAERNRGNLAAAFAHYDEALLLDPTHRGAHEYAGEASLLAGNLARAEEHLAALDKLCARSCEEYQDLQKSIVEYRKNHAPAR